MNKHRDPVWYVAVWVLVFLGPLFAWATLYRLIQYIISFF